MSGRVAAGQPADDTTGRVEHLTIDQANLMQGNTNITLYLTNSLLVGVSAYGTYSGANNAVHGFLRHPNGTFTTFDTPGAITDTRPHTDEEGYIVRAVTTPQGINQAGELAGYYGDAKGVVHGFVRHKDGAFDSFDAPGASHTGDLGTFIMSINKYGDLAGYYYAGQGDQVRGFVLKRPPAPGADDPTGHAKSRGLHALGPAR